MLQSLGIRKAAHCHIGVYVYFHFISIKEVHVILFSMITNNASLYFQKLYCSEFTILTEMSDYMNNVNQERKSAMTP